MTVTGASVQRQFPFTASNFNLFADLSVSPASCSFANFIGNGVQPVALNADGSLNSCANPAQFGSTLSLFAHGVGALQLGFPPASQVLNLQAFVGSCSEPVTASLINGFVYRVDVAMPASLLPCANGYKPVKPHTSSRSP